MEYRRHHALPERPAILGYRSQRRTGFRRWNFDRHLQLRPDLQRLYVGKHSEPDHLWAELSQWGLLPADTCGSECRRFELGELGGCRYADWLWQRSPQCLA